MNYLYREITESVLKGAAEYPVVTITGPRQSGKSTLSRRIFPEYAYFTLEDPDIRTLALSDPRAFLSYSSKMVLDEIQRAPELLSYIKTIVDTDETRRFVLTGSSDFALIKGVSQTLAGRTAIFELLPLSWGELPETERLHPIDQQLIQGFYPSVRCAGREYGMYYKNYTSTYIERDLRRISEIKNLDTFQRFMRLCAGRIGNIFVASEIANDLGVSVNTINSWLSVLQASYIIYMLQPFGENINRRLVKSRKLYFVDCGLAAYLLGIHTAQQMNIDRMRGAIFENFVIMQALKKALNQGVNPELYFFRDSNGVEIDLMIKSGTKYNCYEIKSAMTYHSSFEKSLNSLQKAVPELIGSLNVIYTGDITMPQKPIRLLNLSTFYDALS